MATLIKLVRIYDAVMDAFGAATSANGLGITTILGFPILGGARNPTLPLAAVVPQTEDARTQQGSYRPRIGQTQPPGSEAHATLYLYANNERELLAQWDNLRESKRSLSGVTINDVVIAIRYGPTRRIEPIDGETQLQFVCETELIMTWNE